MFIKQVHVHNFRCFSDYTVTCNAPITLIQGNNGTGKTSILEALYYAAYLRSFRTSHPAEMIAFDTQAFTIGVDGVSYEDNTPWHLHIGCSDKKRIVKKDQKTISSYKELLTFYRVMHIIEDDMDIIKGGPKSRRSFIDQSLMLYTYYYASYMRAYKKALAQRSALLEQGKVDDTIWLKKMWEYATHIVNARHEWVQKLEDEANSLLTTFFPHMSINISYVPKHDLYNDFDTFYASYVSNIQPRESYKRRVRFGPHLDDMHIYLTHKTTRTYASRGQQKLVMVILKLAAIRLSDMPILLLVDDMFADFDSDTICRILDMLAYRSHQIIMTAPGTYPHLVSLLESYNHHTVSISK